MRRIFLTAPLALMCVLAVSACGNSPGSAAPANTVTSGNPAPTTAAATTPAAVTTTTSKAVKTTAPAPSWPVPEDCVSYDPGSVSVHYEAGIYQVEQGTKVVARASGGPGEDVGDKLLALAQNYSKHCYIGRTNNRANSNDFVFDYWRDDSGSNVAIPGQDNDCSPYNRNNLTVEDMGGGDGWRVKDHDHVLQLFDNGTDAKNGKLVLAKYNQICSIGDSDDNAQIVTYML